jgi:hypothetical protein
MKRLPLVGLLAAVGCVDADARAIELPADETPVECFRVLDPDLSPGNTIVRLAGRAPASAGLWALVLDTPDPPDGGGQRLFLRLLRPGEDPPPIDLGFSYHAEETVQLARDEGGFAYLLRAGSTVVRLWIADPQGDLVASADLSAFPDGSVADWDRRIVQVEGRTFVLAAPRRIDGLSLAFHAAAIDGDIDALEVWELPFVHPCEGPDPPPPEVCAPTAVERLELSVAATSPFPEASEGVLLFEKRRIQNLGTAEQPLEEIHSDLSLLLLSLDAGEPRASLLTLPGHDQISGRAPPAQPLELGLDPFTTWIRADDVLYAIDPVDYLAAYYAMPTGLGGSLLQLPWSTTVGRVEGGAWRIHPFLGDDPQVGGEFGEVTLSTQGVAAVESAGPGLFLVRRQDGAAPILVGLDCTEGL